MADKTTTLKTKTNDNVYPNVIGDNRDNAIVDSAHIKHTLTADHKINFRIDDNVSNLIFNSLQKPKGLTKTELVGVGANGQENIEIGDNLTLANGKLSATGSKIKITYMHDSFTWNKPSSQIEAEVGYTKRTYSKELDDNELPMLLEYSGLITIGTAKFIPVPVSWIISNTNNRGQAVSLVCIVAGTIPANTPVNIGVKRVRVVSE